MKLSGILAFIVIIASIIAGILYFVGQEKAGSVMDVRVYVFYDSQGIVHIVQANGTLREVNKVSLPKGNDLQVPGVVVNVIYKNNLIGYWTSEKIDVTALTFDNITTYKLAVGLFETPKRGDPVSITAKIVGFRGEEVESVMSTFRLD